jgi:hypothetical protein
MMHVFQQSKNGQCFSLHNTIVLLFILPSLFLVHFGTLIETKMDLIEGSPAESSINAYRHHLDLDSATIKHLYSYNFRPSPFRANNPATLFQTSSFFTSLKVHLFSSKHSYTAHISSTAVHIQSEVLRI